MSDAAITKADREAAHQACCRQELCNDLEAISCGHRAICTAVTQVAANARDEGRREAFAEAVEEVEFQWRMRVLALREAIVDGVLAPLRILANERDVREHFEGSLKRDDHRAKAMRARGAR